MDCRSLAPLIAIVAGLALVPFAGAATIYTIQDLGSLGGQASAAALNNSNLAVGYSTDGTGAQYAVSFTNGTVNSLGGGQANAVNDSGAIAGTVWAGGHAQATRWANGQQQALTGLGGADSYGMGINASGQIAGSASLANGAAHAAVWSGGLVTDLGTLGGNWSSANAVNGWGQIAGTSETSNGAFTAFFGTASGTLQEIGTLGGRSSYGMAINGTGEVVGNAQTASGYSHAFSWTQNGLYDLGTLGGTQSYAYGVNDAGSVVGYSYTADGAAHAFVFSSGVLADLNSLLPIASGWTITGAYAINNSGVIAGTAFHDGVTHAIELMPGSSSSLTVTRPVAGDTPEPLVNGLVGLGLVLLGSLYRTRILARARSRTDERVRKP